MTTSRNIYHLLVLIILQKILSSHLPKFEVMLLIDIRKNGKQQRIR